ncbi:MAG: FAD-dependent oxidoreductase, partial [Pseudomonadota bacterium]
MANTNITEKLAAIVGADWVFDSSSKQAASYIQRFGDTPRAVAKPATVKELQRIVKNAHEEGYALWVLPTGTGNGAVVGESEKDIALVDLSRMNKIIEIDPTAAYALIEPGVTFQQLYDHLQAHHPHLWIDCDRNNLNSVSGSISEREYGYTPFGDRSMMQCGM